MLRSTHDRSLNKYAAVDEEDDFQEVLDPPPIAPRSPPFTDSSRIRFRAAVVVPDPVRFSVDEGEPEAKRRLVWHWIRQMTPMLTVKTTTMTTVAPQVMSKARSEKSLSRKWFGWSWSPPPSPPPLEA